MKSSNDFWQNSETADVPIEPPQWRVMNLNVAVCFSDLVHTSCIRFMTQSDYDEIKFKCAFIAATLEESFEILEQSSGVFNDYVLEGLGTVKILSRKTTE